MPARLFKNPTNKLFFFAIIAGTMLLFWPYFKWLILSWRDNPADTFGYMAPIVSLWAFFLKRKKILSTNASHTHRGWLFLLSGLILSIFFHWNGLFPLACIALPLYLYGLFLIIWGKKRADYLLFPIFFLIFLYPWTSLLNIIVGFQLRLISVFLAFFFFKTMGMDAAVSGTMIFTGRFLVDIAPACSGLKIMNLLFFLVAIGAYLYRGTSSHKALILLSVIPLAILLNAIRVVITGLIGHFMGGEAALGFYHDISGMLVFGIALLSLYGEAELFKYFLGSK